MLVPIDRADDVARLERRRLPVARPPTATTTTTRSTTTTRGATPASAYDHEAALALAARARRGLRRAHAAPRLREHGERAARRRAGRLRARHRAARALVVRGRRLAARRSSRSARARASTLVAPRRRARALRARAGAGQADWAAEQLGQRRRPLDVVGAGGRRHGVRRARRPSSTCWRAGAGCWPAARSARAARAAGQRLGVHGLARDRRCPTRASASTGHRERARAARSRGDRQVDAASCRNLARRRRPASTSLAPLASAATPSASSGAPRACGSRAPARRRRTALAGNERVTTALVPMTRCRRRSRRAGCRRRSRSTRCARRSTSRL